VIIFIIAKDAMVIVDILPLWLGDGAKFVERV
jgi:hypothetical protein